MFRDLEMTWRPAGEPPPVDEYGRSEPVLVCAKCGDDAEFSRYWVAYWDANMETWAGRGWLGLDVLAWMPLPEVP
jgi:hypothetical protein